MEGGDDFFTGVEEVPQPAEGAPEVGKERVIDPFVLAPPEGEWGERLQQLLLCCCVH